MTVLLRLKESTAQRHRTLEAQMPVLQPGLTLDGYRQLLRLSLGYYRPLEQRVPRASGWLDIGLDAAARHNTPRLVQDLLALGDTRESIAQLADCGDLPPLDTAAQLLGCLYVIEGAALGGQIITRHLGARFGLTAANGAAFFGGHGATTGSRWKAFCALLTAHAERPGFAQHTQQMLDSADQTFASLERWMFAAPPTAQLPRQDEPAASLPASTAQATAAS